MVAGNISSSSSSSSVSSISSVTSLSFYSGQLSDESTPRGGGHGGRSVKFLCSYGGKILPRYPDGTLRYVGGDTRVLAVDRSLPFSELVVKLGELCGWGNPVSLKCQLPTEDLDALVSVTSDEDLANLIGEYDLASREKASPLKIRAFLFQLNNHSSSVKKKKLGPNGPPMAPRISSSPPSVKGKSPFSADHHRIHHQIQHDRFMNTRLIHPQHHHRQGNPCYSPYQQQQQQQQQVYLVHHGNHWQ